MVRLRHLCAVWHATGYRPSRGAEGSALRSPDTVAATVNVAVCDGRCLWPEQLRLAGQAPWGSNHTEPRSCPAVRCTPESRAAARRRSRAMVGSVPPSSMHSISSALMAASASILCDACSWVNCQCFHHRPWRQIKDQSPLPDAVPGRFTGAVFVAEEKPLDARFRCRPDEAGEPASQRCADDLL